MSTWQRYHLSDTVKALATSDNHRFFIQVREPPGEQRHPLECYRWTLREAQDSADRIVNAYYPHDCDEETCGVWRKFEV
ncbi:MAG TPA: hypothetical protein VKB46_03310 [Pyrinomonadaceae bacterium]|nr:hypothetical protein [Pyrinomonadaceae bacterium]